MYCHNCGNHDSFVLSVELAVPVPQGGAPPEFSLTLACDACASTHVAGNTAEVLASFE